MVRVGFPGGPRLEWYDRNPQISGIWYSGDSIAPHGYTQRAIYTVPTGKKAWIPLLTVDLLRDAVDSALGRVSGAITVAGNMTFTCFHHDNTVGHREHKEAGTPIMMLAGQSIVIGTTDEGADGAMDYRLSVFSVEFDA